MSVHLLPVPWGRGAGHLYSSPGRLLVKLRLGEAPDHVPSVADVRGGHAEPGRQLDGGPVDRLLGHFSDRVAVARVHSAARSLRTPGRRHLSFDALEHTTGLARTFRVDLDRHAAVTDLVDSLRCVASVEQAWSDHLIATPFEAVATPGPTLLDADAAWAPRDQVGAAEAMAYEPGDAAVVVAIVDTGASLAHPELSSHLRRGVDLVRIAATDVATGVRLLSEPDGPGGDPEDNVGHGTACAGIVAAHGRSMPPGLAGSCGVLPIRVLAGAVLPGRPQPVGIGGTSDIDRGVKSAIDLGAAVVNMSFGTPEEALDPHDPRPHEDVVAYGLARGCVMVAASGNSGRPGVFSPASIDGVLGIGASDLDGRPAAFSTSGPHVALLAPGVRVLSAALGGYAAVSGTSFAAPFVAAAAALLVSRARARATALEPSDVGRLLQDSAMPHPGGTASGNGAGTLHAHAALRLLDLRIDAIAKETI